MKNRIFILIIPAILIVLCPIPISPAAQLGDLSRLKRVALVIGNGNYRHVAPLSNPENDARDMADTLKNLGFATTLQLNQDRSAMFRSLRLFGEKLGGNTAGLFFFAGHGVQVNHVNYLLPTDADAEYPDEIEAVGIKANLVLGKMESAGNPLNLVILDSCRNNPFKQRRGWAKNRAALSRGLAGMSAPGGTMLIFATQPGETASDGDGQNSPFTLHLIRQMQVPGLEVGRMIRTVALQVEEDTRGNQTPWIEGILKGDFYFTQGKDPDEEMWEKIKNSSSADVFQVFIDLHPGSAFVPAARERIVRLKAEQERIHRLEEEQKKMRADSGETSTITASLNKSRLTLTTEIQNGGIWKEPVTGMEFVWVPGGCYQIGCGYWTSDCFDNEKPVHEVCVDGFWLGKYEVTIAHWKKFVSDSRFSGDGENRWKCSSMGEPEFSQDSSHPAVCISWKEAEAFARWISGKNKKNFRLPTEAEWEYAARSGGKAEKYAGRNDIDKVAWYGSNSGEKIHSVGTKAANGLGIYDMTGNVSEWCMDWYDKNYYSIGEKDSFVGPDTGSRRVIRGGGWGNEAKLCRSANRTSVFPVIRDGSLGFRLLMEP